MKRGTNDKQNEQIGKFQRYEGSRITNNFKQNINITGKIINTYLKGNKIVSKQNKRAYFKFKHFFLKVGDKELINTKEDETKRDLKFN